MKEQDIVTSICAKGFVVADYDTATFNVVFNVYAPKAKAAKEALKKGVEQIAKTVEFLKTKGVVFVKSTYRTGVSVMPNSVYVRELQSNRIDGQKATYTLSFQTTSLDMVNEIYDTLSELDIPEYTVNSPVYSVRAVADLKQHALEDAWRVAQVLFTNQCNTLGFKVSKYIVASWAVDYTGGNQYSGGKGRNMSNATPMSLCDEGDDTIAINAGKATVEVTLTVDYVSK